LSQLDTQNIFLVILLTWITLNLVVPTRHPKYIYCYSSILNNPYSGCPNWTPIILANLLTSQSTIFSDYVILSKSFRCHIDANLMITWSCNPHAKIPNPRKPIKSGLIRMWHKDNLYLGTKIIINKIKLQVWNSCN